MLFLIFLSSIIIHGSCQITESASGASGSSQNDIVFNIFHSVKSGIFTHRSNIQLVTKPDGKHGLIYQEKNGIFGEEVENFKKLLNENGLYKVLIHSTFGNHTSKQILSSIPAVKLYKY
jgi:hypothetical protein